MITIQANKLQSKNLENEFLLDIEKIEFKFCDTHQTYNTGKCSFCSNNLETFYYQSHEYIQIINEVILDINNKPFSNELYNAGISSYDQEINKQDIQKLLSQNISPHEIAIQLQMYNQDDIKQLINDELLKIDVDGQEEIQLQLDLWKISQTKTYLDRAYEICKQLNLKNCNFIFPAQKSYIIQFESNDKIDCMASQEISNKFVKTLIAEIMKIADKKVTLPENTEGQSKRILSRTMELLQCKPFYGELVYFTNMRRDLLAYAQKFGNQQSPVHIYCKSEDLDYYYNSGGAAGFKVNSLNSDNIEDWEYRVKVDATNNVIFLDSQTNNVILKLQKNQELSLEFELINNEEAFFQVIVLNKDGKCLVQQQKIELEEEIIHQPSDTSNQISEQTLKLTEYSKY